MKILIYILISVVFLIAGFYLFNAFIYNEKQEQNQVVEPYAATVSGEHVCLLHKDQTGPQTDECAFGLVTDAGEYYALDFSSMSVPHQVINVGDRITAVGTITPIQFLSTDEWSQYIVDGILSVTTSLEVSS